MSSDSAMGMLERIMHVLDASRAYHGSREDTALAILRTLEEPTPEMLRAGALAILARQGLTQFGSRDSDPLKSGSFMVRKAVDDARVALGAMMRAASAQQQETSGG